MLDRFTRGAGLALRFGATSLIVVARLASRWLAEGRGDPPARRLGLGTASKAALDELFLATELAAAPVVRAREQRRLLEELREALALFEERGWIEDPALYHRTPPPLTRARLEPGRAPGLAYQRLSFESGYEPHPEEPGRERWLGYQANRTAHAWMLRHRGQPRPWLVCVPGYRMGHPLVDFAGFRVRWLHRQLGLNVAIPVLPLHGPRRIGRRGGDGYFSGDFVDTVHAQAQALWDVRRVVGWLRANDASTIGVYGVSLGAYTTAMLASTDQDLECVVAGIPAADFARLIRSHVPSLLVRAAERFGFSFDRIERLLRVVSPFALQPGVPGDRCYLYAGLSDRLASPDHAHDLWEHWGRPRVVWYQGSHLSFLWERAVKELLMEALEARGMLTHSTP